MALRRIRKRTRDSHLAEDAAHDAIVEQLELQQQSRKRNEELTSDEMKQIAKRADNIRRTEQEKRKREGHRRKRGYEWKYLEGSR